MPQFAGLIDKHRMAEVAYETVREYASKRSRKSAPRPRAPVDVFV
ncbi:hypothetical protein [Nocardia amamiensis]